MPPLYLSHRQTDRSFTSKIYPPPPFAAATRVRRHHCGRRVSCHRGRNRLDVKEPFQEETNKDTPSSEEKHKYIFEGTEYDRPPNLFDVGGELKLLPEVLSDLNFDARDFVDDGTAQEQKELRDSRPWGRLHIDGWPAPIQYLRSHVGGPAVDSMRPLVLASPLDACEPLQDANPSGGGTILLLATAAAVLRFI